MYGFEYYYTQNITWHNIQTTVFKSSKWNDLESKK